jgi:hypothetical protein
MGGSPTSYWPFFHFGSERIISRCNERTAIENGKALVPDEIEMNERTFSW